MAKLLFVLVSLCVYCWMSFADTSCQGTGKDCKDGDDRRIMECCLARYKLGFDNLGAREPNHDPPSCGVDLVSFLGFLLLPALLCFVTCITTEGCSIPSRACSDWLKNRFSFLLKYRLKAARALIG